ncbi:NAD-dependent epimerase/dehydratase [Macrophomina phaseolina MS6]|uniref:NAD-dependent epimerase/dehydratase n=1 Tax=Macrophomina phaseolina (strain MS6) TaxID=1126212 RepID=K2R988_MACPH|nr:NAD-dependent epimerase/dehydratase [Macrophomina phaseolina MS6]
MFAMNKVLLTGATGYVGGTVLDHLVKSEEPGIKGLTFDLLVRSEEAADKLRSTYGNRVRPILWKGFTDIPFITDTAANYDIVINAGTGFIADGAKAFIQGLAHRIKPENNIPWMLHLSGASNLADHPLTQTAYPERVWDDADGNAVYEFLKAEDAHDPYPQRTTEIGVLSAAEEMGVQAVSLNTPCLFGTGTGLFNQQGFVIPTFMRYVIKHGYGFKLNETANFDWVHVEDLADLYVLLLRAILERKDRGVGFIPSGRNGIISTAVGHALQTEMMNLCLDAAFNAGILPHKDTPKQKEIRQISLQEIADEVMSGLTDMAERSWAGHKTMKGTMAKKLLGWNPTRLEEAWKKDYSDVLDAVKDGNKSNALEKGIGK